MELGVERRRRRVPRAPHLRVRRSRERPTVDRREFASSCHACRTARDGTPARFRARGRAPDARAAGSAIAAAPASSIEPAWVSSPPRGQLDDAGGGGQSGPARAAGRPAPAADQEVARVDRRASVRLHEHALTPLSGERSRRPRVPSTATAAVLAGGGIRRRGERLRDSNDSTRCRGQGALVNLKSEEFLPNACEKSRVRSVRKCSPCPGGPGPVPPRPPRSEARRARGQDAGRFVGHCGRRPRRATCGHSNTAARATREPGRRRRRWRRPG